MGVEPNFAVRSKKKVEEVTKLAEAEVPETQPAQMPIPTGYKLLIGLPEIDDMTEGGLAKAAETIKVEQIGSIVGFVIALGPDAYQDKKRFSEPYCKEGDFIIMRSYSGTRIMIHGREFRLINDDSVEAVVLDPRGIAKA